jgi:hypothetical protein
MLLLYMKPAGILRSQSVPLLVVINLLSRSHVRPGPKYLKFGTLRIVYGMSTWVKVTLISSKNIPLGVRPAILHYQYYTAGLS